MTLIKLENYEKLIADFSNEDELFSSELSLEATCKLGLKKLNLARKFVQIDHEILDISINSNNYTSGFFTDLIYLEAKRLRFKEQAIKCQERTQTSTKNHLRNSIKN